MLVIEIEFLAYPKVNAKYRSEDTITNTFLIFLMEWLLQNSTKACV